MKFTITEEERRSIRGMYLMEQVTPMSIGGGTPSPQADVKYKDYNGFYAITYSPESNISSVINSYNGGKSESKRYDFSGNDLSLNPQTQYIAFSYWFDNKAGNAMKVTVNAKTSDGKTVTNSWANRGPDSVDTKYFGRFNLGPLPDNSTITVSVAGDSANSLTITTKQTPDPSVNCDAEWKVVYEKLEDAANENTSVDIRPYYCNQDQTKYIKGIYPDIDNSKLSCLKKKIKTQYC